MRRVPIGLRRLRQQQQHNTTNSNSAVTMDPVDGFGNRSSFEFELTNVHQLQGKVCSPRFETMPNIFWQLGFVLESPNDPEYCAVYLHAICNMDEVDEYDPSRNDCLPARMYLKRSDGSIIKEMTTSSRFKFKAVKIRRLRMAQFCRRSRLTDNLIIGVRLKSTQLGNHFFRTLSFHEPVPVKPIPGTLISAWKNEFQKPGSGDVKITVQGQTIFASSSILAKRSEYFQRMFNGSWLECNRSINEQHMIEDDTISNDRRDSTDIEIDGTKSSSKMTINRQYQYSVDIPDFDYQTAVQMLLFLYTDQVDINNCPNIWNLYTIANKYLITDLEMEAKLKILEGMSINTAAESLFGNAWKWPDLKKRFLRYVVDNFSQIRNSHGYKTIVANRSKYPMFLELNSEILLSFIPETVES
ncbi:POZ domain-containing protein [Gigaspora margarita]|uniref:POZ domain-containing protein n=1 Tax=Gigaspora margarita TaxID=4874 RepID=A0A8H3X7P7_GIGMA|nr:POZ domain-containing protein [Gigaspora margarita]